MFTRWINFEPGNSATWPKATGVYRVMTKGEIYTRYWSGTVWKFCNCDKDEFRIVEKWFDQSDRCKPNPLAPAKRIMLVDDAFNYRLFPYRDGNRVVLALMDDRGEYTKCIAKFSLDTYSALSFIRNINTIVGDIMKTEDEENQESES